jgi:integrase
MKRQIFTSVFADELNAYIDHKVSSGYKAISFSNVLKSFDRFCVSHAITSPVFTMAHVDEWIKKRQDEAHTTHYSRMNKTKNFLLYLSKKGFNVVVPRDVKHRTTEFQPHIYSEDEIARYFEAVDTFNSERCKKDKIQYPVLFRILYCCGTRINETLGIRKKDIDLEDGIIRLLETKNDCERYIVLGDDLLALVRQFASKCFYLLNDEDYVFTSQNGKRLQGDTLYDRHRKFLKKAGIPYIGNGKGPRIHDWRHTFSVHSFKQMVDSGLDMYVALPILSAYLGHKSIAATEQYVRLTMSRFPYIEEKFKDKLAKVFAGAKYENY